ADAEPVLMAPIIGFDGDVDDGAIDDRRPHGERVLAAPLVVPQVVKALRLDGVAAALGYGVDDATGGAPVLRRVVGRRDLELLHRAEAQRVAETGAAALFGEKRLRVVAAVHRVVVEQSGDAAEADQAEGAVRR